MCVCLVSVSWDAFVPFAGERQKVKTSEESNWLHVVVLVPISNARALEPAANLGKLQDVVSLLLTFNLVLCPKGWPLNGWRPYVSTPKRVFST